MMSDKENADNPNVQQLAVSIAQHLAAKPAATTIAKQQPEQICHAVQSRPVMTALNRRLPTQAKSKFAASNGCTNSNVVAVDAGRVDVDDGFDTADEEEEDNENSEQQQHVSSPIKQDEQSKERNTETPVHEAVDESRVNEFVVDESPVNEHIDIVDDDASMSTVQDVNVANPRTSKVMAEAMAMLNLMKQHCDEADKVMKSQPESPDSDADESNVKEVGMINKTETAEASVIAAETKELESAEESVNASPAESSVDQSASAAPESVKSSGMSAIQKLRSRLAQVKSLTTEPGSPIVETSAGATAAADASQADESSSEGAISMTVPAATEGAACAATEVSEHAPVYSEMQLQIKIQKLQQEHAQAMESQKTGLEARFEQEFAIVQSSSDVSEGEFKQLKESNELLCKRLSSYDEMTKCLEGQFLTLQAELQEAHSKNTRLQDDVKARDAEIVAFRTCFLEKDKSLQERGHEAAATAAELTTTREKNVQLVAEVQELSTKLGAKEQQRIKDLEKLRSEMVGQFKKDMLKGNEAFQSLKSHYNKKKKEMEQVQADLSSASAKLETSSAQLKLAKTKLAASEEGEKHARASLAETATSLAQLQKAQQGQNRKIEEQGEGLAQAQAELEALQKESAQAKQQAAIQSDVLRDVNQKNDSLKVKLFNLQEEVEKKSSELANSNEKAQQLQGICDELMAMAESKGQ